MSGNMKLTTDDDLPRRRDEEGDFHQLERASCASCGCTSFVAKDDPSLLWEPGPAWDDSCRDRTCHCHSQPVIGTRKR
jgi:hypothetical protein